MIDSDQKFFLSLASIVGVTILLIVIASCAFVYAMDKVYAEIGYTRAGVITRS